MSAYIGIIHFGLEFCVFVMSFAISYVTWQIYLRNRQVSMMEFAFGFTLIGLSGVIHSFNLTGETYLGLMFVGRISGYLLIVLAIHHQIRSIKKIPLPVYSMFFIQLRNPILYLVNTLLALSIVIHTYRNKKFLRANMVRKFCWGFSFIAASELLFSMSREYHWTWNLAHCFKIAGFLLITLYFLRSPQLRIVDKLHVVLRGLVLFTMIFTLIPFTILMLYNIRETAFERLRGDAQRIMDYINKDKQRVLTTAQIYTEDPVLMDILQKKGRYDVPQAVSRFNQLLKETGHDFIVVMDRNGINLFEISSESYQAGELPGLWLVEKAYQGQRVVTIQDNLVSPLDIACAIPIKRNDEIVGILITGLHITDSYMKKLGKNLQLNASLFQNVNLVASSYEFSDEEKKQYAAIINSAIRKKVLNEKLPFHDEINYKGQNFYSHIEPLLGPQQKAVGMIFTGIPAVEFESRKTLIFLILIFIAIPVTILAWYLGERLSRTITRSVHILGDAAKKISEGNLNIQIPTNAEDELSDLGRIFNQMISKLQEIDSMKSDFYSFISHEIRTPLTALRGAAETLMETSGDSFNPDQRKMLDIVIQNSQRLNRLVDNLLELAKLEAGKMSFNKQPVDVLRLIQKSIETYEPLARKRNIQLEYRVPAELPKPPGDGDWLTQVLNNLISNAIKFTPEDGIITISAEYRIDPFSEIIIQIKDPGIGIPKEELNHIFDKYHQVKSSLDDSVKGTGLGLSICKYIIEEVHHGKIWAESELGKGSQFTFTIPVM